MTLEPDSVAALDVGERDSADLYGNVVLLIVSAHSERQAMLFSIYKIPAAAREGWDCYNDPEGFGLRAYKLASTDEEEEG